MNQAYEISHLLAGAMLVTSFALLYQERIAAVDRATADIDQAVDLVRRAAQAEWKAEEGFSLTYLPFIVRAFADAVRDYPAFRGVPASLVASMIEWPCCRNSTAAVTRSTAFLAPSPISTRRPIWK